MRPDPRVHWDRDLEHTQPPRVVVAEDDVEMRALVVSTLRRRGYEVVEARDGKELIDVVTLFFAARQPRGLDAVVSDIRMRGATGLSALEAIRAVDPALPVILMTAFPSEYVTSEAARLGARALLEKPFDLQRLVAIVGDVAPCAPSPLFVD